MADDKVTALTPAQMAEAEALCAAASRGSWKVYFKPLRPGMSKIIEVQLLGGRAVVQWGGFDFNHMTQKQRLANARFIAASRTLIPRLLSAHRAQAERIREMEKEVERLRRAVVTLSDGDVPATNALADEVDATISAARAALARAAKDDCPAGWIEVAGPAGDPVSVPAPAAKE
jgi:hypothetical protein